jgi:hypothetical protein
VNRARLDCTDETRFLLAHLQVNYVLSPDDGVSLRSQPGMKNALETLPKTPEEAYKGIFEKIQKLGDDKTLALTVLSWVYHAKEPLRMNELQEAISFMPNQTPEARYSPQEIIASCKSLVVPESNIVKFVHLTVKEWLTESDQLPSVTELAECCIRYLGKPEFDSPKPWAVDRRMISYPFSLHAACHWAEYINESDHDAEGIKSLQSEILNTFKSKGKRESMYQIRGFRESMRGLTLLHMMAAEGLVDLCEGFHFQEDALFIPTWILTNFSKVLAIC